MQNFNALIAQKWAAEPGALRSFIEGIKDYRKSYPHGLVSHEPDAHDSSWSIQMRDDVAIISLDGILLPKPGFFARLFGACSMEKVAQDITTAAEDPRIQSIILDIDSPGGVAIGPSELAEVIAKAKKQKPIVAYVGGTCASAAYWIASACTEIVAHKSAMLGSVGVIQTVGVQEAPDFQGYKHIEILSSNAKNKRPDPMQEDGMAEIKREIDSLEKQFLSDISSYREIDVDTVIKNFGQGGMLIASEAIKVGMADRTGSFEDVLSELKSNRLSSNQENVGEETMQTKKAGALQPEEKETNHQQQPLSVNAIESEYPEIASALRAEGAKAERDRLAAIDDAALEGHEDLVAAAKKDPNATAETLAVQIIKAQKAVGSTYLSQTRAAVDDNPDIDPKKKDEPEEDEDEVEAEDMDDEDKDEEEVEKSAKKAWKKDKALRSEFGTFKTYLSYVKAANSGRASITTR